MALKVDDTSITQALKLKHYKDFCEAIKVADDPTKILRVKEFRNKFNSLGLSDGDEKGWVQTIGATVAKTGKTITDSFTWAVALRQKLNGPVLDTLRNAIEKLGTNASDWFDVFNVGANMLGDVADIATTLGAGNVAWLQNVPLGSRSLNPVQQCLDKLKTKFKSTEIRTLWTTFQGLDAAVIWTLADQATGSPLLRFSAYRSDCSRHLLADWDHGRSQSQGGRRKSLFGYRLSEQAQGSEYHCYQAHRYDRPALGQAVHVHANGRHSRKAERSVPPSHRPVLRNCGNHRHNAHGCRGIDGFQELDQRTLRCRGATGTPRLSHQRDHENVRQAHGQAADGLLYLVSPPARHRNTEFLL